MKRLIIIVLLTMSYSLYSNDIKILFVIGDVKYSYNNNYYPVRTGDSIPLESVIETGERSVAIISSEGFNIKLSGNTKLVVKNLFPNASIDFTSGKIWVKVDKLQSGQSFIVKTPTSNAGVRGTEFIYDIQEEHKIYVLEGKVAFSYKNIEKLINNGEFGVIKGNIIEVKPFTKEDLTMARLNLPSIVKLKDMKSYYERGLFRKELYKEINLYNRDRGFISSKRKEDIATGRTLTDENGNTIRVAQTLRRLSDNTLQIVNITKKGNNSINVVEYKSIYSGSLPNGIGDIMDIISGSGNEIMKIINIIQVDGIYIDRMKIVEDKTSGSKVLKMGITNNLTEPNVATVDYTKLQQIDNNPYLSANYTIGANSITLKVYLIKDDGTIVPVSQNVDLGADFLMNMSFKFIFDDFSPFGGIISNPNGISFHVLPDIGFVLINELVK